MNKLIVSLALAGFSLPLLAEQSIQLTAGSELEVTSVSEVILNAGERQDNVWFSVEPAQISNASEQRLSNCVLTASIRLEEGEILFNADNLRCPSFTGDVYTAEELEATLNTSIAQICSSSERQCSQVTFTSSQYYSVTLDRSAELAPAYNASREVNRMRVEEQYQD